MDAILITGNTYPARRELRSTGAIFDRSEMGYVARADNAQARTTAERLGLTVREYEATEEQLTPATGERLRAIRQDRQDRRADRLRSRADAADRRADKARSKVSPHEREFLRLCEPVKIGHHSQRRHEKLIAKAQNAFFEEGAERVKAAKLRSRADWLQPAQIAGDAERKREARRVAAKDKFSLGDTVECIIFGIGTVIRVNRKSLTVAHATRGFSFKLDLCNARLVAKGDSARLPAAKFKAGDLVTATRLLARYQGVIKRRTSRGYSVEYVSYGRTHRETFAECDLSLRSPE